MDEKKGEVRACTDDIAAVLWQGADIRIMKDLFTAVEKGACLKPRARNV